jgi:hypothetical protein
MTGSLRKNRNKALTTVSHTYSSAAQLSLGVQQAHTYVTVHHLGLDGFYVTYVVALCAVLSLVSIQSAAVLK